MKMTRCPESFAGQCQLPLGHDGNHGWRLATNAAAGWPIDMEGRASSTVEHPASSPEGSGFDGGSDAYCNDLPEFEIDYRSKRANRKASEGQ